MTPHPTVSVIMPARNAARSVGAAVQSMQRQTFTDWELLVADDGSNDATPDVLARLSEPRLRVWTHHRAMGLPVRLNQLIDEASGAFIARMDADDMSFPSRLAEQITALQSAPNLDVVGCSAIVFDDDGRPTGRRLMPEVHEEICRAPYTGIRMIHPTFFARAEWFRKYRYDERLARAQDQDLLLRAYRTSRFGNVPRVLFAYRENKISLSKRWRTRLSHRRAVANAAIREGRPWVHVLSALAEVGKAGLDAIEATPGIRLTLKSFGARPLPEDCETWHELGLEDLVRAKPERNP